MTSWPSREQFAGESILWELDVADRLGGAVTISSVGVSTLLDVNANQAYPTGLSGASAFTGTKVRQKVTGLVNGKRYFLTIPFVDSAANTQVACVWLECAS